MSITTAISHIILSSKSISFEKYHLNQLCSLFNTLDKKDHHNILALFGYLADLSQLTHDLVLNALALTLSFKSTDKFIIIDFYIQHLIKYQIIHELCPFIDPLKSTINLLIQGKRTQSQTNSLLTLSSMLIRLCSAQSFFKASKSNQPHLLSPEKFINVLLSMFCAEVRVLVDDYKIPTHSSFITEIDDSQAHVLPLCLESLDYIVMFISNGLEDVTLIDSDLMLLIRVTLTEGFQSIAAFLDEVYVSFLHQIFKFTSNEIESLYCSTRKLCFTR